MTEPLTTIAVGTILNLAFQEFVKSGAGEVAKKSAGGAIELAKDMRDRIVEKFRGDRKAEEAIAALESNQSAAALKKLEVYLEDEMAADAAFAERLRQVAEQMVDISNRNDTSSRVYGDQHAKRDIVNIEKVEGNMIKFGGS
jgi:hypothetical protein